MHSFFEWAYRTDRVSADPMRKVEKRRKGRGRGRGDSASPPARSPVSSPARRTCATRPPSSSSAGWRFGARTCGLLQVADVDLARDELHLRHVKGGEEHVLPIGFPDLQQALYLHLQAEGREPAEFLLYAKTERTRPLSRAGIDHWLGVDDLRRAIDQLSNSAPGEQGDSWPNLT